MSPNPSTKYSASVKVMRSHDYCHFEVTLTATDLMTTPEVDEMRKEAARLADKAVEQYQIAKSEEVRRLQASSNRARDVANAEFIRAKAEGERTIQEQAMLKAFDDKLWSERPRYDYQDDWDSDYDGEE